MAVEVNSLLSSPRMLVDGVPAVSPDFQPNRFVWVGRESLSMGAKLWRCYDAVARLPSTRAALVIQIQGDINICHHFKRLVINY